MATAQQLFTQAWIDLGVGAPGQTPSASQSANGLAKLNIFIDMLSGARDLVYEIALASYLLTNSVSFSIGPTADAPFNVPRPVKVETADIILTVTGATPQTSPLHIATQDEWRKIRDKGAKGTTPELIYVDPSVPNSTLFLHPIPLCAVVTNLQLGTWNSIGQFATLATNLNLPPTYYQLLLLGLELQLAPTYGNVVNPVVLQLRQQQFLEALNAARSLNSTVQGMQLPSTAPQQGNQAASNPDLAKLVQSLRG